MHHRDDASPRTDAEADARLERTGIRLLALASTAVIVDLLGRLLVPVWIEQHPTAWMLPIALVFVGGTMGMLVTGVMCIATSSLPRSTKRNWLLAILFLNFLGAAFFFLSRWMEEPD